MSKPWTKRETKFLLHWLKLGRIYGYRQRDLFEWIAGQLRRSKQECQTHWKNYCSSLETARLQSTDSSKETDLLEKKLKQLEKKLEHYRREAEQISQENKKLKKEIRFFEAVLLEEYQLLLQLLNKEKKPFRIHSIN